jgi:site-specific recombinase XerD
MSGPDFARYLTDYLARYLPGQRNLSTNTIASYRDSFRLFLLYCQDVKGIRPEKLSMDDIDKSAITGFLDWLESERGSSVGTRNQRLCAVKAFVQYVQTEDPKHLLEYQRILSIKQKKTAVKPMSYLSREGLHEVLCQPDLTTIKGRRDLVLLALLYDSGARVSELCGITIRDVRPDEPATITLFGKGRKIRSVPLMASTASLLQSYLTEHRCLNDPSKLDDPLFPNSWGRALTRSGVAAIVDRHVRRAREKAEFLIPERITPHSFRHQKAVDLLEAGVPLLYIRDLLGHRSVTTTEIYSKVSAEKRRETLEKAGSPVAAHDYPDWTEDENLMVWLSRLCH